MQPTEAAVWAAVSTFCFGSFWIFQVQGPGSLDTHGKRWQTRVPAAVRQEQGKGSYQGGLKEGLAVSNDHDQLPLTQHAWSLCGSCPSLEGWSTFSQCSGEDYTRALAWSTAPRQQFVQQTMSEGASVGFLVLWQSQLQWWCVTGQSAWQMLEQLFQPGQWPEADSEWQMKASKPLAVRSTWSISLMPERWPAVLPDVCCLGRYANQMEELQVGVSKLCSTRVSKKGDRLVFLWKRKKKWKGSSQ